MLPFGYFAAWTRSVRVTLLNVYLVTRNLPWLNVIESCKSLPRFIFFVPKYVDVPDHFQNLGELDVVPNFF